MRILMLTPYLPYPPASGGQIRTLNLLKYLKANHHITLISLYKNDKEKQYAKELKSYCNELYLCKRPEKPWQLKNILKSVFTFLPFLIVRNYSDEAHKKVTELLAKEKYDVIHAETFYIMPHIPKTNIPILLVEQTIEFKVYQHFISSLNPILKAALNIDILKLKYWEKYYWKKATLTATVSDADQNIINQLAPEIKHVIIPNGAGDEMFVSKFPAINWDQPLLLFVGNFSWLQNVEAAEFIINKLYDKVKDTVPNARLMIAGQNAKETLNPKDNSIEIVNIAPDDTEKVKELYHKATLFIAPIYGPGGTRLKILAAMASGVPVISTPTGVEGMGTKDGEHVLIASEPDEFVNKINKVLKDKELYTKIQEKAFKMVKDKYSWPSISKQLEIVYRTIRQLHENRN